MSLLGIVLAIIGLVVVLSVLIGVLAHRNKDDSEKLRQADEELNRNRLDHLKRMLSDVNVTWEALSRIHANLAELLGLGGWTAENKPMVRVVRGIYRENNRPDVIIQLLNLRENLGKLIESGFDEESYLQAVSRFSSLSDSCSSLYMRYGLLRQILVRLRKSEGED